MDKQERIDQLVEDYDKPRAHTCETFREWMMAVITFWSPRGGGGPRSGFAEEHITEVFHVCGTDFRNQAREVLKDFYLWQLRHKVDKVDPEGYLKILREWHEDLAGVKRLQGLLEAR